MVRMWLETGAVDVFIILMLWRGATKMLNPNRWRWLGTMSAGLVSATSAISINDSLDSRGLAWVGAVALSAGLILIVVSIVILARTEQSAQTERSAQT